MIPSGINIQTFARRVKEWGNLNDIWQLASSPYIAFGIIVQSSSTSTGERLNAGGGRVQVKGTEGFYEARRFNDGTTLSFCYLHAKIPQESISQGFTPKCQSPVHPLRIEDRHTA